MQVDHFGLDYDILGNIFLAVENNMDRRDNHWGDRKGEKEWKDRNEREYRMNTVDDCRKNSHTHD